MGDLPRSVAVALPLMPAVQALPSASPKTDDAFQGSSGQDVPAQVELIHSGLDGNIRFLRIPGGWGRREADIVDHADMSQLGAGCVKTLVGLES